ncbi:hypothetical protein AMATHDRAFT_6220 [Amanita thiersii Skay4041]|uniref:Uncharacterized protein n=1 Tax=Amanita thiersii Skay4041 TaxID=703135 RepID=A0A2A9ND52_9AGAR|nr:hypothetical protein AMATHDRAFT_6220 [Amanita thiersii Skay4041]
MRTRLVPLRLPSQPLLTFRSTEILIGPSLWRERLKTRRITSSPCNTSSKLQSAHFSLHFEKADFLSVNHSELVPNFWSQLLDGAGFMQRKGDANLDIKPENFAVMPGLASRVKSRKKGGLGLGCAREGIIMDCSVCLHGLEGFCIMALAWKLVDEDPELCPLLGALGVGFQQEEENARRKSTAWTPSATVFIKHPS